MLINKLQPQRKYDCFFEAAGPSCTYVMRVDLMLLLKEMIQLQDKGMQHVYLRDWFVYAFFRGNGFGWCIDSSSSIRYRQHSSNQAGVKTATIVC